MIYGAIAGHEADLKAGDEERTKRADTRRKDDLVPVKRFDLARHWLAELFKAKKLATQRALWETEPTLMILTDASPQGCGANSAWTSVHAYEYEVSQDDADLAGFELGSHRSQSYLETLAIFVALKCWGAHLATIPVGLAVRSDSMVALAVLDKASSSSPALNMLAAEISLRLEKLKVGEVSLSHIPGRPQTRGEIPHQVLKEVKIKRPPKLTVHDFCFNSRHSHDASVAGAAWVAVVWGKH